MSAPYAWYTRLRSAVRSWPEPPVAARALTLVCALELFVVQELTLRPMHHQTSWSFVNYRLFRFLLDLVACAALVVALPRAALAVLFVLNAAFYVAVLVYHGYYHQPLSFHVLVGNSSEGAAVSNAVWPLVHVGHAAFLAALALKLFLLTRGEPLPWNLRRSPTRALSFAWVGLVILLNPLLQPLHRIGRWESVGGLGSIYGYLVTWAAEAVFLDPGAMRDRAVARARGELRPEHDRLTRTEGGFPVRDRLVFLQVESFDAALIGLSIGGQEVTPQMNRLKARAMHWVVQAPKGTGSSDADFKALMGLLPSADVPTYKIPGYPYEDALPRHLSSRGYRTLAIHGVTGEFFDRRRAYGHMGFDELIFREEFVTGKIAPVSGWTVPDAELLDHAALRMREARTKVFALVITATSHIPFPLPRSQKVFFPASEKAEDAYFDSQHYVDAAIGKFVTSLPPETTVVLYGDHTAQIENPKLGYRHVTRDGAGCVPFFVVDTTLDLRALQTTSDLAATCEPTLLEALRWVHHTALSTPASPESKLHAP